MKVYKQGECFEFGDVVMRASEDLAIMTRDGKEVIEGEAAEIVTFGPAATRAERVRIVNALTKPSSAWGRR